MNAFATMAPIFLPDTTPIFSNAAFQLLAFALESRSSSTFTNVLAQSILNPLNLTQTGLLNTTNADEVFGRSLNSSMLGEQASMSLYTTTNDLAQAGHAMLSSRLLPAYQTRRWVQPVADTSNLRNSMGRPWEIYHAGQYANSSILDVYTKAGVIGKSSSYCGLAPDFNTGFAILAHDTEINPDLNVYVDIVSLALLELEALAASETAASYTGRFISADGSGSAILNVTDEGPGLVVTDLSINGSDLRADASVALGIPVDNLDFKLYPSNVQNSNLVQFISVFQDRNASVDAGTPTCITWMNVGSLGSGVPTRFILELDDDGVVSDLIIPEKRIRLSRA
jgi:hypothetical protein